MTAIRTLTSIERHAYRDHLLRLDAEGRRLRFGQTTSDDQIETFISGLGPSRHRILAHFNDQLEVIGAALLLFIDPQSVELAFSVELPHRGQGLGRALMQRSILHARNRRVRRVHLHMLAENRAMSHLARSVGAHLESAAGEHEGFFEAPPMTPLSVMSEILAEQAGLNDWVSKAGHRMFAGMMVLQPAH